MTDIRLIEVVSLEAMTMDWLLKSDGTLDESNELATAVSVALGTDALADAEEILPWSVEDNSDRRGWWGDYQAQEIWNGWPIGVKNWLLRRAKITDQPSMEGGTVERARVYTQQALQPFIDQRVCTHIDVTARRFGLDRIYVGVVMHRGDKQEIALQFQILWSE